MESTENQRQLSLNGRGLTSESLHELLKQEMTMDNEYVKISLFNNVGCLANKGTATLLGECICQWKGIKKLSLGRCGLKPASLNALLTKLKKCCQLEELSLYNNGDCLTNTNTATLLGKCICKWKGIKELNLGRCGLKPASLNALLTKLKECCQLEKLSLCNNKDCLAKPHTAKLLGECICKWKGIKTLSLGRCGLTTKGFGVLITPLCKCEKLKELRLHDNDNIYSNEAIILLSLHENYRCLSTDEDTILDECRVILKKIQILTFGRCGLTSESLGVLSTGLSQCDQLKELSLCKNNGCLESNETAKRLGDCLGKLKNIRQLNLGRCGLTSESLGVVSTGLSQCDQLKELSLCKNNGCLEYKATEGRLGECLGKLKNIRVLNLGRCGLTSASLEQLITSLDKCLQLENLSLFDNISCLANKCTAKRLGDCLGKLKNIRVLNLGRCGLTSASLEQLITGLKKCLQLENLSLFKNNSCLETTKAASRLGVCLSQLEKLKILTLSSCGLTDNGLASFSKPFISKRNKTLRKFNCTGIQWIGKSKKSIRDMLRQ